MFGLKKGLVVFLIMLTLLNFGNVGYYFTPFIFIVLLFYKSFKGVICMEYLWLLLFSVSYTLFSFVNDVITTGEFFQFLLLPSLCYVSGKFIAKNNLSDISLSKVIFLLVISYSCIAIISVLLEIKTNGFIALGRNIPLVGLPSNHEIAATGINARMLPATVGLGLLFTNNMLKNERIYKIIALILFVISIVCVVRLGSRTGLVSVLLSTICSFLYNWKAFSNRKKYIFITLLFLIGFFLLNFVNDNEEIMFYYADRANSDQYGAISGGGRTELWIYYGSQIFTKPFGAMLAHPFLSMYAHNLWIDVARVVGIIPFILLLLFTISSIKTTIKFISKRRFSNFFTTWILVLIVGILAVFGVEPVLEGVPMIFMFYCFLIGMMNYINEK